MARAADKKPVRIDELQKAVAENPTRREAHMRLGTAWLQAGAANKAEAALRRAVEIDPEFDEAWVNLGGLLLGTLGLRRLRRGEPQGRRSATPELLQAHYNQGLGHLYLREAEEMIACFRRVLEIDPDHAAGHYHLAVGLLEIGEVEAARAALDRAVELGHSPAPEFLKALERKDKSAGTAPRKQRRSDGRSE